jgi:hypothetical protein
MYSLTGIILGGLSGFSVILAVYGDKVLLKRPSWMDMLG